MDTTYLEEFSKDNSGFKYLGCIVDHLSKYAWVKPMKSRDAKPWADFIVETILEHDAPMILHSDNGGEFQNKLFWLISTTCQIQIRFGAPYQPQQQGAVERFNQTIKNKLGVYMQENSTRNWLCHLPVAINLYRMARHSTTLVSPFEAYFGREPRKIMAAPKVISYEHSIAIFKQLVELKDEELNIPMDMTPEKFMQVIMNHKKQTEQTRAFLEHRLKQVGGAMEEKMNQELKGKFKVGDIVRLKQTVFSTRKRKKNPINESRFGKLAKIIAIQQKFCTLEYALGEPRTCDNIEGSKIQLAWLKKVPAESWQGSNKEKTPQPEECNGNKLQASKLINEMDDKSNDSLTPQKKIKASLLSTEDPSPPPIKKRRIVLRKKKHVAKPELHPFFTLPLFSFSYSDWEAKRPHDAQIKLENVSVHCMVALHAVINMT